ncbi:Hypothetical predicted protein [Olea europaea subsp. europaea]|uniref:DUF1985 domain-containing protein n=1 Tax=Olea europaea subsp. europaea TaxID=158383 RepID=A0A8S0QKF6_OLEEU|nr:Hypothetical predicted protein [Olea europaea subsp. europaea]
MEFQFLVPENVRLPVRISQRSNLKYIKTVMDNFDDRLRADFRDFCLGFFADVPEIQFSTQLIQALGHLTRFGLQEYAIVTGLHAGSFSEGDRYTKALEKRGLKEKYFKSLEKISCAQLEKAFLRASTPRADRYKLGLALIVEGVITALDNNVGIDEDTLAIVDNLELFFSYPGAKVGIRPCLHSVWADINATFVLLSSGQIWAYEAMPELDERFSERVGERSPRLLCWTSTKQPQQRTYDAFFKDVQLHVHATLRSTEVERDLPYIASLVPFSDRPVQFLDDLARKVVGLQFHEAAPASGGNDGSTAGDGHNDESGAGAEDVDTSGTRGGATLTREDVEGMLYDQHILFEIRLRTVKLEIMQHLIEEFTRLRDFISTLVPPSSGTSTSAAAPIVNEPNLCDDPTKTGKAATYGARMTTTMLMRLKCRRGTVHGEGGDDQSPEDNDCAEEGDM